MANRHPRWVLLCPAALALLLAPSPALSLAYVESSQGLIPPELEGGRTEIEFADVDNDGNVDLVSIGDHGSPYINTNQHGIMVWFGDGQGRWSVRMTGNFGYGGIAIGDVNGDGFWDAAYGMHHNYASGDLGDQLLEAALGDGTGTAWTPWDDGLATAGEEWGMFGTDLADVDNDGDLDIGSVSFGCCAGLHVYENRSNGTWIHLWGFLGGNSASDFLFGDVNADGFADLVAAHAAGTVYLGDGTGSFTNADGNLAPGGTLGRNGPSLADIDNDGDLDIAYRGSGGSLQVWRYEAQGQWTSASAGLPTSGISATQLADMDGDGWCDLVALGSNAVRVWLGNGGSAWTLAATIALPSPASYVALRAGGDIDHNGRSDIAVISEQGSWPSYRNVFRVFRETTVPAALSGRLTSPRGGERMVGGSIRFIDWISEVPGPAAARASIDLSVTGPTGPWIPIAENLANGGRYQWRVPVVPQTDQAYLRLRLSAGELTAEALTPRPFAILPPTAAFADETPMPAMRRARAVPNPTTGAVRLVFPQAPAEAPILILDAAGRAVRRMPAGVVWDGRDDAGRPVPSGVYHARRGEAGVSLRVVR